MQKDLIHRKNTHIKIAEPMSQHLSLRAGGLAKVFFTPESLGDLIDYLKQNRQKKRISKIYLLGLGSNLLVRDGGFNGLIIATKKLKQVEFFQSNSKSYIWAEAGAGSAKVAQLANKKGFNNLNFLVGIPGSIGGALAMNAGCHFQQTWQNIKKIEWLDFSGNITELTPLDFEIGYRKVKLKNKTLKQNGGMFYRALFLANNNPQNEQDFKPIDSILKWRANNQPINKPNCGSVFKNPKNCDASAGKLIELAGLKGFTLGGAEVSTKHANFIINQNSASASDIENLIHLVIHQVYQKFSIQLEAELVIIGESL